ncbi:MAG TPA: hypothetical protein VEL47_01610 [Myxococcota bacterium]|nr:hypothetical protein [Myxococcota bacterium]
MQKKIALLVCAMTSMIAFKQAVAAVAHPMGNNLELTSADGNFRIGFKGNLQENNQFTYRKKGEEGEKDFKMELKRARLILQGHAFRPSLTYLVQTGFEKPKGSELDSRLGANILKDYYVNLAFNEKYAHLRVGKFLTPLSRQQMMSNTFDQDEASKWFGDDLRTNGRDVGLMLHNTHHHPLEYALAAVSSGIYARIGYNHNHIDGYDPVDWHGGGLRFGIAKSMFLHFDYKSAKFEDYRSSIDAIVKIAGFAANAAFYWKLKRQEKANKEMENIHGYGAGVDLGYLIHGMAEPVVRYSWHKDADSAKGFHEILAGINYYPYGHHLKIQAYGGADVRDKDLSKWKLGLQVQFAI